VKVGRLSTVMLPTFLQFMAQLGIRFTPAQRVLCAVAFDGVQPSALKGEDRRIFRLLFGDLKTISPGVLGVVVLVAGARSGKSWISALRLLHLSLTVDLRRLAPGEQALALIVAPDMRLARIPLRFAVGALEASPYASTLEGETADSLTIRRADGRVVVMQALPASRGGSALRGQYVVCADMEESAFFRDEDAAISDLECFRAITPRVLPGGQIIIGSTPWGPMGLLHDLWKENHGKPTTALSAHAPTLLMRDNAPDVVAIVEREQRRDPLNAAREYGASFASASSALLSADDVDAAVDAVDNRPPEPAYRYGMTADIGLRNDATAVMVFHFELRKRPNAPPVKMLIVDAVRRLAPSLLSRVSIDEVEECIASLAKRYRIKQVHTDLHYADAIGPRLAARGLKLVEASMGSGVQETRAMSLAAKFTGQAVRLIEHPELVKELKELKVTRHAGGRSSIGAPGGKKKHDDCADCLLLAVDVNLPATGGDIIRDLSVTFEPGNFDVQVTYRERTANGRYVPAVPPLGTPEGDLALAERQAAGIICPGDPGWSAPRNPPNE
jgi:hypothetical protein